jgi:hypothetical protein
MGRRRARPRLAATEVGSPVTWLSAALPYIGGGVLGSAATYGLSWARERRRSLDAYRAPQREAIGDIVTAAYEYMLRGLEQRMLMTDLVEQIRTDTHLVSVDKFRSATRAAGAAYLGADRSFQIASLVIVDAQCWKAMVTAYAELERLRAALENAPEVHNPDDVEQHVRTIADHDAQFRSGVGKLVRAAYERVSPAESRCNRRQKRQAQRELGELFRQPPSVYAAQ